MKALEIVKVHQESDLDIVVEDYCAAGWKRRQYRKGVLLVQMTWGRPLYHFLLFLLTPVYGNLVYLAVCRTRPRRALYVRVYD